MFKTKIFPALALLLTASLAHSDIIVVQHTFDGGAVDLHATNVDQVGAGVSTTWAAKTGSGGYLANGTIGDPGNNAHLSAFVDLGSVINDYKTAIDKSNGVFTLTTVFNSFVGDGWLSSGFQAGAGDVNSSAATGGGLAWLMWDADPTAGAVKAYDGPNTGGTTAGASLGTDNVGSVTLTTVLDLSGYNGIDNWGSISYSFNGGTATNSSFTAEQNFDNLQISSFSGGGSIASVELTQIPEPSSLALIGIFGVAALWLRRKKSN